MSMDRALGRIKNWSNRKAKSGKPSLRGRRYQLESLEPRQLLAAQPIISEFLASNDTSLLDEDNQPSDWIELTNIGDAPINLAGWHLTDNPLNLDKWTFPSTMLNPGQYLIVFASGKDRAVSSAELHTDFQLDAAGDYLALVAPDETTIVSQFGSASKSFPEQISDVSYGVRDTGTGGTTLVGPNDSTSYFVPTNGSLNTSWTQATFNDNAWSGGPGPIGYEYSPMPVTPPLTGYAWSVLRDNPSFYWNFDETDGPAMDLVRGQANDRLQPSAGATRVSHQAIGSGLSLGRAASLDGDDAFTATALGDGQMPGAWAVEFWVQATGAQITPAGSSGFRNDYLLNFGGDGAIGGDNPAVLFDQSAAGADNKIELYRALRTGANGPSLNDTSWHHVVLTFYGNGTSIGVANRTDVAIDGVVTANIVDNNFSSVMTLSQALVVGARFANGSLGFEGRIDELALYDLSGLTLAQVDARANAIAGHYALGTTSAPASPLQGIRPVSYTYSAAPGGSAAYEDAGRTKLNDGAFGSTATSNFGNGEWAGWNTTDPTITFDLGESYDLTSLTIDYSVSHTAGVHAPGSMGIQFSSDGTNFSAPVTFTDFNDFVGPGGFGWSRRAVASFASSTARYARLTLTNADQWTFLSEVQFIGSQAGEPGHGFEPPQAASNGPLELLGYWDFNDRTSDLSGHGSNATLEGATYATDTPAALGGGKSLQFNASSGQFAEVPDAAHLRLSGAFTISTWMKSTNINQPADYLISRNTAYANPYGSPSKQYAMIYEYVDNRVELFAPSRLSGVDPRPGSQLAVADTNWHHVVYTYDGTTFSGYVDGEAAFSTPRQFVLDNTFASSWFFGTANPDVGFFSGYLDDIAMWNGALSPAQVSALAAGSSPLGVGGYSGIIATDLQDIMHGLSGTVYTRHEFNLSDPAAVQSLLLKVQYDDGFVAYLNGTKVAEGRAPAAPTWNSLATSERPDEQAIAVTEIDISAFKSALISGQNVLAIHGLNVAADDDDFLLSAELVSFGAFQVFNQQTFFTTPSPGVPNGGGIGVLGPEISEVTQPTGALADGQDQLVTARIAGPATATLFYRVNYGAEVALPMNDAGTGGDVTAGDGVYSAVIPASASAPGQMLRYYVRAVDLNNRASRYPMFLDPTNSPEYLGTVIADGSVTSQLPIFQWFIAPGTEAAADTRSGTRASLFYGNELYDNIFVRLRGRSINSTGKLAYKFDFNQHHHFLYDPLQPRVEELDLGSTGLDKSYVRPILGFELFEDAGAEYSVTFPMRVQRNGQFFSVAWFIENPDEDYLARNGLDPDGAFYKANLNGFTTAAQPGYRSVFDGWDKKTREWEDNSDIVEFTAGVERTGDALVQFLFDNVDIASQINYMAAEVLLQDADRLVNNFYVYRDTEGDGLWHMIVWDLDLSQGQYQVASDVLHADDDYPAGVSHPYHGIQSKPDFRNPSLWNNLLTKLIEVPQTREMFVRRLRTLMDDFLKPTGTPTVDLYFEKRMDELFAQMSADVALDKAKWGNRYGAAETFLQSLNRLKNEYYAVRRTHLFQTHVNSSVGIPAAQIGNPNIQFGQVEHNPASGDQDQEYIQLVNPNPTSVDISGWKLTGGVTFTFDAGTVIPANGVLYVSPDIRDFKARTSGPRGGQGLFVVGGYDSHISNFGETIELHAVDNALIATVTTPTEPTAAQLGLRITEMMYHPAAPTPAEIAQGITPNDESVFEFVELQNVGATTLELSTVEFAVGIRFDFSTAPDTTLDPGERILVVSNRNAFELRYGTGQKIAGEFTGNLSNGGEPIQLDDLDGGTILEFAYDDVWYPSTDGPGNSLVIIDPLGPITSWDLQESWRPSSTIGGTPGTGETVAATIAGRHVFYNNSRFDGDNAGATASDDAAIATDKAALLPGGSSTFANYTSFNRGLNGIMVDIAGLPTSAALSASDFQFKVGNSSTTSAWTTLSAAPNVTVRAGAGAGGASRVTLIWPTGAAIRQWLQVTVKANSNTGLGTPDVFYFGNAVGESGNVAGDYSVSILDELQARNNPVSVIPGTNVLNRYDYNRDGTVSVIDQLLARNNLTTTATKLQQISVPAGLLKNGPAAEALTDNSTELTAGQAAAPVGQPLLAPIALAAPAGSMAKAVAEPKRRQVLAATYNTWSTASISGIDELPRQQPATIDDELLELLADRVD